MDFFLKLSRPHPFPTCACQIQTFPAFFDGSVVFVDATPMHEHTLWCASGTKGTRTGHQSGGNYVDDLQLYKLTVLIYF